MGSLADLDVSMITPAMSDRPIKEMLAEEDKDIFKALIEAAKERQ